MVEQEKIIIRPLRPSDANMWLRMRLALWPDHSKDEMRADMDAWLSESSNATFLAEDATGELCGFIEVGQRKYAEGCKSSPVGYIEGWYVDNRIRKQGVGKMLVMAAEDWAREQGWAEIASDTWLDNETSIQAHLALGYKETDRLIHFSKKLS